MGPLKPVVTNGQVTATSPAEQVSNTVNSPNSYASSIVSTSSTDSVSSANADEVSLSTVKSILEGAKSQIQTQDMAQYYDKLITAYDLDNTDTNQTSNGSGALSSLTDIQKINYAAMSTPLIEAGKNIKDKDIAKFYYKFLQDTGWDIKP